MTTEAAAGAIPWLEGDHDQGIQAQAASTSPKKQGLDPPPEKKNSSASILLF